MIKFKKNDKKEYEILNNEIKFLDLELVSSSITNKFEVITETIEDISIVLGDKFDSWLVNFLTIFNENPQKRLDIVLKETDNIRNLCNEYMKIKNIDYSTFVNRSKIRKTSIVFDEKEIEQVLQISCYFKVYSLISNTSLKLDDRYHKIVFNHLLDIDLNKNIVYKIFEIIRTKTYSYNLSDRFMWVYIESILGKEIDTHIIEIFNFVMNNILVLCRLDKNPITFFVTVIDTSIKWLLRGVYKATIMYEDDMSTADIQTVRLDSLRTITSKDTLTRLKSISLNYIHSLIEQEAIILGKNIDNEITNFQNRISKIDKVSPVLELVMYPILSIVTGIQYYDFLSLTAEHAAIISVYIKDILKRIFKSQFETLFDMLDLYPAGDVPVSTTYKLKNVQEFINQSQNNEFFGFKTIPYPYKIISSFVGKMIKMSYYRVVNGDTISCLSTTKIESDAINFFLKMFSGELEKEFKKVKSKLVVDF